MPIVNDRGAITSCEITKASIDFLAARDVFCAPDVLSAEQRVSPAPHRMIRGMGRLSLLVGSFGPILALVICHFGEACTDTEVGSSCRGDWGNAVELPCLLRRF